MSQTRGQTRLTLVRSNASSNGRQRKRGSAVQGDVGSASSVPPKRGIPAFASVFPSTSSGMPSTQPLPASPQSSRRSSDTDFEPSGPGPAAHSPMSELRNQALHITQLNIRLSEQGRLLAQADERIQLLDAEIERLTDTAAQLSTGEQPNRRRSGPPCGMLTRRGQTCSNPLSTCRTCGVIVVATAQTASSSNEELKDSVADKKKKEKKKTHWHTKQRHEESDQQSILLKESLKKYKEDLAAFDSVGARFDTFASAMTKEKDLMSILFLD
ncbi:hypothetical protein Ae201684P_013216 [Aphanomyces euteiches]|nr:hypothetical protein Ae201684P_013216 [Aphanomyces euteiches]